MLRLSHWTEVWLEALLLGIVILLLTAVATAGATKVGNGDDGGDLEGAEKVETGILIETRAQAVELLKNLRVHSIEHLGHLLPEVEKSQIYLVRMDMAPKISDDKGMTVGGADQQSVYARTFAEPHAATRFFPKSLMLGQSQLVALHIHEGLHRALPAEVREDESIVSAITLALTSADTSFDRVRETVDREVGTRLRALATNQRGTTNPGLNGAVAQTRATQPEPEIERPSSFTYTYRSFLKPNEETSYPVESLQSLQSFLYPFGTGGKALGVGIELSYLRTTDRSFMGPLELSGRMRLLTYRSFDVGLWGTYAMNTLSDDEFQNSPLGRDVASFGLSARREAKNYYIENRLSVSPESSAKQKIGKIEYEHNYGTLTGAEVRAGGKYRGFEIGGFAELLLSDNYVVKGGAFKMESGRYRIFSAGPELAFNYDSLRVALSGRFVIDHTPGVNLDYAGDLMGRGVGQGSIQSSLSFRF